MSFAAKPTVKPMSMATKGCQISVPSLFTPSKASYSHNPYSSIPFKPIKLELPCLKSTSISLPYELSLKKKEPIFRVCVIAPQQEEDHPVLVEEQDVEGDFKWDVSGNEGIVGPSQEAKVYVGYLPYDVDSEQLAKLFEEAGVVEIAEIVYNRETGQSRGFGFVTMSTVEEAEKAMEMFHHYDVNGRLLVVNKASRKGSRAERPPRVFKPTYRIYVGNLPWGADDSQLEQLFSEYGKVVSAHVLSERDTGRSRGFGFVVMSSESEMNDAIDNLDGQIVDGRAIKVNVAAERQPRRSF